MIEYVAGGICVAVILGFAAIIVLHNVRVRRVRKASQQLSEEVRERVLDLIREAASRGTHVTFWYRGAASDDTPEDWIDQSHLGGTPYAEVSDTWPEGEDSDGQPPRFLMQLRLCDDGLGVVWRDRLITVFLQYSNEQIVRSYARPSRNNYVPLTHPDIPLRFVKLHSLPIPVGDPDEPDEPNMMYPATPGELAERIPGMAAELRPYTGDVEGGVTQILRPGHYGYSLDTCHIMYEGGEPGLIQNEHDPECEVCGGPMRFLFQFGEMFDDLQLADGGVVYVYGCDAHPDCCRAFLDTH